jgi:SPP1 gp7 family putative phage head morphogenesis protein
MAVRAASARETPWQRRQRRAQERKAEEEFRAARNAHATYSRQLRQMARQVARIIEANIPPDHKGPFSAAIVGKVQAALARYTQAIDPWARAVALRMLAQVNRRDRTAWASYAEGMGLAIRKEIHSAPIMPIIGRLVHEQAQLITSLPMEAAQEVQRRAMESIETGRRFPERIAEIKEQLERAHPDAMESWLLNRATLIARTETARAQSTLTMARAEHIGSDSYIWRTAEDWKVRESHRKLNNSVQRWDAPPLSDPPDYHSHPGMIWNCYTAETLAGPFDNALRVFRARYSGLLVVLRVGDTTLRVTPDHPILTPSGWVAAGKIQAGDDVIQASIDRVGTIEQDVDGRLLPLGEVFETCGADVEALTVLKLHGDIANGDVDVVGAECYLSADLDAVRFQGVGDEVIAVADRRVAGRGAERVTVQIGSTLSACARDVGSIFSVCARAHHQTVGSALVTPLDAGFAQQPLDDYAVNAKALAQRLLGGAVAVGSTNILRRQIVASRMETAFSGHVFTLQTKAGYYIVGNARVITKNCRCIALPIIPQP